MQRSHAVILAAAASIAAIQAILASTTGLSRWKGGGFGMYTDPHPYQSRIVWLVPRGQPGALHSAVRLYPPAPVLMELIDRPEGGTPAVAAADIAQQAAALRSFPRDGAARRLLERIGRSSTSAPGWRIRVTEVATGGAGDTLNVHPIYDGPGDDDG